MPGDLERLQGDWYISALEMDGQLVASSMLAGARVVVRGNRFTSTGMGSVYEGSLKLDARSKPAKLDMNFDAGPEKGNVHLGIYQIDGDSWTLCLATRGTIRPSSFASTPGSGIAVEKLSRTAEPVESSVDTTPPSAVEAEFEGEWTMLAATMDGKDMDPSMVKWVRRVNRGDESTVTAGPQTMLKVRFTCDATQSPHTIDYLNLAGVNKGKPQSGIYKFEGDVLTYCVAPPGAPRPQEFASIRGDNRTLTSWRRA